MDEATYNHKLKCHFTADADDLRLAMRVIKWLEADYGYERTVFVLAPDFEDVEG